MRTHLISVQVVLCYLSSSNAELTFPWDIYGDYNRFDPSHSISVDDSCRYTATLNFNVPMANLPFPSSPASCTPEDTSCEGQSCIQDVRNVYRFSEAFQDATGFKHVGLDFSPCGHPPIDRHGKPHVNVHMFRITPEYRASLVCDMNNPFFCTEDAQNQTTPTGRMYYDIGRDAVSGKIVNVPESHELFAPIAVPGLGQHASNFTDAPPADEWFEPTLMTGLYGGDLIFFEPMVPYEFVSGDTANFYDEAPVYFLQTIMSLPSYWSLKYDPDTQYTTVTIKGKAEVCDEITYESKPKGASVSTSNDVATSNEESMTAGSEESMATSNNALFPVVISCFVSVLAIVISAY